MSEGQQTQQLPDEVLLRVFLQLQGDPNCAFLSLHRGR